MRRFLFLLSAFMVLTQIHAQNLKTPRESPAAFVSQEVGIAKVTVDYSSPSVKGRKILGDLIPFGLAPGQGFNDNRPFPWRAGANENTVITFSHDAKIEGKSISAGSYGLHMIPSEKDGWVVAFSKNSTSWGSFFYEQSDDALRVTVNPVMMSDSQERLIYSFEDITNTGATAFLRWEKLKIPIKLEFDTPAIVLASIRNQLKGADGFNTALLMGGARWCLARNINLEEATMWVTRAEALGAGTQGRLLQADLLEVKGKTAEAQTMRKAAIDAATEGDLNTYGYQLLGQKKTTQALEIFQTNVKKFPKSWNVFDSLAEALEAAGSKNDAVSNYKKAMAMAPDDQKTRIQKTLDRLQKVN